MQTASLSIHIHMEENTVDFSSSSFRGIVIDVIAKNHNGKRYKWPAVNVSTVKRFGRSYYLINTSDYKKLAKRKRKEKPGQGKDRTSSRTFDIWR